MEAGDNPVSAETDIDADVVNVLTVHKAKGLEFSVVFMVGLVSARFPRRARKELLELPNPLIKDILPTGDFHLEEERRLFYVGMTRAKREIYLTSALDYGGVRHKKISQFVLEAMDIPKVLTANVKSSPMEVINRSAPAEKVSEFRDLSSIGFTNGGFLDLSSYQIDDYRTCPLKYKYIHILNVPVLPHHTIIYGKAIHDAISTFFNKRMDGESLSLDRLIMAFEASWKGEGFVTREHELQRLEAGREVLKRFYHKQEENGIVPSAVERSFNFEIGDNKIKGRWDLIEAREDGPYIIDFKTSEIKEQKKADERARKSLQLNLYIMAYRECFKSMPAGVELHFLESGLVGRASPGEKEMTKTLETIKEVASGIRNMDYTAKPDYLNCSYCPFTNICSAK